MVPKSLPKTHPFTSGATGRPLSVVDDGEQEVYLETAGGHYIGPCRETGPEILKLAEQGRALWNALDRLLTAIADGSVRRGVAAGPIAVAVETVRATAATFDHNEPEEPTRHPLVVENGRASLAQPVRHDPNRQIPLVGPEEEQPADVRFKPKFGELLRGVRASESNPHRDGLFVREIRHTGKLNPGVYYELTDGIGDFWEYPSESVVRPEEVDRADD